jgi:hypothetical protein
MHTAVLVPDDIRTSDLERALRQLGLIPRRSRGGTLIFERPPGSLPPASSTPLCQIPGCQAPALVTDVGCLLCSDHWMEMQVA